MIDELEELIELSRRIVEVLKKLNRKNVMFTAFIGECLVLRELLKRGFCATWKGKYGFGKYDIAIGNKRIEVKTATYSNRHRLWGFGGISPEKFDYLICVALDDDLRNPRYVIFTKDEAKSLPTERQAHKGRTTRFDKGGKLTFHLFNKEDEGIQPSEKLRKINRNIRKYMNWSKIRS